METSTAQDQCHLKQVSSILMLFYYLALLQNDCILTSQCMQFTFGDKEETCWTRVPYL